MAWIKRNLFIALSSAIGLILLGGAGFYVYTGWSEDSAAQEELTKAQSDLDVLQKKTPLPTRELVQQVKSSQEAMLAAQSKFNNVLSPATKTQALDEKSFKLTLDTALVQLQNSATNAGVRIGAPDYAFSFSALTTRLNFPTNYTARWLEQLQDVKELCGFIFASRVNILESIRRTAVSSDEQGTGGRSDYLSISLSTNQNIVSIPYEITIQGFSRELADLLNNIEHATNLYAIRTMDIQPGNGNIPTSGSGAYSPSSSAKTYSTSEPSAYSSAASTSSSTLVSEGLLRAVILVDLIKPLPAATDSTPTKTKTKAASH